MGNVIEWGRRLLGSGRGRRGVGERGWKVSTEYGYWVGRRMGLDVREEGEWRGERWGEWGSGRMDERRVYSTVGCAA